MLISRLRWLLTEVDVGVGVVTRTLVHQGLCASQVLLSVPKGRLHKISPRSYVAHLIAAWSFCMDP